MGNRFTAPMPTLAACGLLLVASATVVSGASAQGSDAGALRTRAGAILRAYGTRDVDALVAFIPPTQRAGARSSLVPGSGRYDSVFGDSSWRWRAVHGWDGALGEARIRGSQARIRFADLESGEVAVVTLRRVDNEWYFDDVHSPSASDFAAWGRHLE